MKKSVEHGPPADRLRMKLPSDPQKLGLSTLDNIRFLPLVEWLIYREKLALQLNINPDALSPGEELGLPKAELLSATLPDFLFHIPGITLCRRPSHSRYGSNVSPEFN